MGAKMINIFLTVARPVLSSVDVGFTRVILLFWVSTLRRQGCQF
jgi:hypothetical protein